MKKEMAKKDGPGLYLVWRNIIFLLLRTNTLGHSLFKLQLHCLLCIRVKALVEGVLGWTDLLCSALFAAAKLSPDWVSLHFSCCLCSWML